MKAKELMIGDWVKITTYSIYPVKISSGGYIDFAIDKDCEPIPLTAEILEKNGFTHAEEFRKGYGYNFPSQYYNGNMIYLRTNGIWNIQCAELIDIKYVHELQRALRCCGLWDFADNFKI